MCKLHKLKTIQPFYDEVIEGIKKFEVRLNDRDFKVGDQLRLLEFDVENQRVSGWGTPLLKIVYILDNPKYCKDGFVIIGFEPQGIMRSYRLTKTST